MKRILNTLTIAVAGVGLFAACSRPVATFQPTKPERFYARANTPDTKEPVSTASATTDVPVAPAAELNVPVEANVVPATEAQATEALASLKATYASNKRLTKRIEKAERAMADASAQATTQPAVTKKMGLAQRLMLKSVNKKIERQLAPKDTYATSSYVRIGAIVALVGLLLLLIGNGVGATIGLVALIVGLVLVLLGVINQG
jgi:hypothetical protein